MKITPVILCGGSGTRLWPLSRTRHPKQFLPLGGKSSLFQATLARAAKVKESDMAVVVANQAHRFLVAEQLHSANVSADILLEPSARNTAPAIAAAAFHITAKNTSAPQLLLILPSDHLIMDEAAFNQAIEYARPLAQAGKLVTFGILPTRPETGYGYIEVGAPLEHANAIESFVEKPDLAVASEYLHSGKHLWNSGIFLIRADVYLDTLNRNAPNIHCSAQRAVAGATHDLDFIRLDAVAFNMSPADSIDYAMMEKTGEGAVVLLDAGWNDIGSWDALAATLPADESGNVIHGDVISIDTCDSYLHSDGRLLATIGVGNLIIATTPDAVLVAAKSSAQKVKDIAAQLAAQGRVEAEFHTIIHRPWGSYEGIDQGTRYQVKRIRVKPGASLSLQLHHHRAEHWIVVKGTAKVQCGDEVRVISENQSTYIPLGMKHRLENPGKIDLELIEVQSGSYLGEDDIVRFEDHYGR